MGGYSIIDLAIVDIKLTVGRLLLRCNVFIVRNRLEDWTIAGRHMKNVHSEGAKRKAEEGNAEDELDCFGFYFEAVMRKERKLTHDIAFWFFL